MSITFLDRWDRALSHPAAASTLALVSYLAFTCMDATAALLMIRGMPSGEVLLARMGLSTIMCLIYYFCRDTEPLLALFKPSKSTALFWIRGSAGAFSLACGYAALAYLSLSEFLTVIHLRPFPTALMCYYLWKETSSKRQIIASVISFGAVLLVVQPEFIFHHQVATPGTVNVDEHGRFIGIILTLICVMLSATDMALCRKLTETYDSVTLMFGYVSTGTIAGVIWIIASGQGFLSTISLEITGLLAELTLFGVFAQICIIMSLARASGTYVTVLGYFQILFASGIQVVLFGQPPNLIEISGMAIIAIAGVWCMCESPMDSRQGKQDEVSVLPLLATPSDYELLSTEDIDLASPRPSISRK